MKRLTGWFTPRSVRPDDFHCPLAPWQLRRDPMPPAPSAELADQMDHAIRLSARCECSTTTGPSSADPKFQRLTLALNPNPRPSCCRCACGACDACGDVVGGYVFGAVFRFLGWLSVAAPRLQGKPPTSTHHPTPALRHWQQRAVVAAVVW